MTRSGIAGIDTWFVTYRSARNLFRRRIVKPNEFVRVKNNTRAVIERAYSSLNKKKKNDVSRNCSIIILNYTSDINIVGYALRKYIHMKFLRTVKTETVSL